MKFISRFQGIDSINEATLDDTKVDIDYILSRPGRDAIERFGITPDLTLKYSRKRPSGRDTVLWIKSASIQQVKFSDLKSHLGAIGNLTDELMVYQTSSKNFPWAVAKKGLRTTMIRQKDKVGAAKRGEHFRETAFLITLAVEAWNMKRFKMRVASNRGFIEMTYKDDGKAYISEVERGVFRKEYDQFMIDNKQAVRGMIDQCQKLIKYLGNDINNISYVIKNTSDLVINQASTIYLKDEMEFAKKPEDGLDYPGEVLNLPTRLSLAKWNPSDMWIIFKGSEWTMEDFDAYEDHEISDIDDLNSFLMTSILDVDGLIGVSLKQTSNIGSLSIVNVDPDKATHKYDGFEVVGDKKTVVIDFSYKFGTKSKFTGGSKIDCRTFDRTNTSNISLEVKGSKKAKHMSGKAGSVLASTMSPRFYKIKEFIRTSTDKQKISEYLNNIDGSRRRFAFKNKDLEEIFYDDINSGTIKTADQNSRMQSIIVIEWLESLTPREANKVISEIVKFAKSESSWSAPHLLVK